MVNGAMSIHPPLPGLGSNWNLLGRVISDILLNMFKPSPNVIDGALSEHDGKLYPKTITADHIDLIKHFAFRPEDVIVTSYPKTGIIYKSFSWE